MRDVVEIQLTRVKAHLVLEPELTLIDCGYAGSSGRIAQAIEAQGRSATELRRVVITHGHPDHAGSARELAALGATLLLHPDDWPGLRRRWRDLARERSRGAVFSAMTPTPDTFQPIEDGEILPMLGGLRVIHTPGHTPGSVCLYGERDRILFVGDTLQRRFGRLSCASRLYSDDYQAARRAVQRLTGLDVETLVFSHYPVLETGAAAEIAQLAGTVI
ncbi:MAG TPA: MBL fold metallo-hydrolase [Candidatus Limnocylindrales bacterium]|nr:MBL fold metallo-hydrolase [Candidatus Limnocylindrales bacterium]